MKTLYQACTPRQSVFEQRGADTVYNLDDLGQINADGFFAENFVTDGMRQLLTEAFKRLEGKGSAAGSFLLSQSMGGGKTHNLVALGLLAKNPSLRPSVMADFYQPGPLGAVRVVSMSGRKTNTPFGLWGEIAEQLNKKEVFAPFYSPMQAPGDADWVNLLRGDPLLVLFDELPFYFEAAQSVSVGASNLSTVTAIALTNLLVAVNSGKLPNVCLVLTDLHGTAWSSGGAALSAALSNLGDEANRYVQTISPVKMNSNELYHILRTRLFQNLPSETDISEVAEAYREQLESARKMDLTNASPDQCKADIEAAYPFHPAIRDLYARFRENQGFQQTRALIRLMRLIVSDLWESGAAKSQQLIGAQDIDLHDSQVMSEVHQINGTLDNAIAHDIASEGNSSVAEGLDGAGARDAQDVAKLLFLSSLSTATNPVLGLDRGEVVEFLSAPGRDLAGLRATIDRLQGDAWYIHTTRDAKLLFRNTENLIAKLETYTRGQLREQREAVLREKLKTMFKPLRRDCYQDVVALPPLDAINLAQESVVLVVFRPSDQALSDIKQFFTEQPYKNRVLFLTGAPTAYETTLQRAAELSAAEKILKELLEQGLQAGHSQMMEAESILTKRQSNFYIACRETFQTLYYPSKNGLTPMEVDPKFVGNEYKGEDQVIHALKEAYKFTEEVGPDSPFKTSVENRLWPAPEVKEVSWADLKRRAASDPSWWLHAPKALDALKDALISRDTWRDPGGGFVQRGPFPRPTTSVSVQLLSRDDPTGEATLRVKPLHGDTLLISRNGPATTSSERLDGGENFKTKDVKLSFLTIDSKGDQETGEAVEWTNAITIRHKFFQDGANRRCELKAVPTGSIRYTTDGSSAEANGQPYADPFVVPPDCRKVLAVAEAHGVKANPADIDAPQGGGQDDEVVIDAAKAATWKPKPKLSRDATGETYGMLELAGKHAARLGGLALTMMLNDRWVEFRADPEVLLSPEQAREGADWLRTLIPGGGNLSVEVEVLRFEQGRDLQDMVAALKTELKPGEVTQ